MTPPVPSDSPNATTCANGPIPAIILSAGEQAVEQYRAFFSRLTPSTSDQYVIGIRRFCRWASEQELSLTTITPRDAKQFERALRDETAASTASTYLAGLRSLFRYLASTSIVSASPFENQPWPSLTSGFDLLALLAMLEYMDPDTLRRAFDEATIAWALLDQVRWPDGPVCPACGCCDTEGSAECNAEARVHRGVTCDREFTVLSGTMFEASPLALRNWLRLIHQHIPSAERLSNAQLAELMGIDLLSVSSFCSRVQAVIDREGTPAGREFSETLAEKDRQLVNDSFARDMIHYAEVVSARDSLLKARAEEVEVADLPAGMSLEEALANLNAQIAEADRWVFYLEDGRILRKLADEMPPDGPSAHQEANGA